jgi:hypothetical protein
MGFLDKLFNFGKDNESDSKVSPTQSIKMGRYSDNNKTVAKTKKWYEAEDLFKEKKFNESIECFFDYLRDDIEDNVRLHKQEDHSYRFEIYQGTKIVHGNISPQEINAEVSLAKMEKGSIPVMRRLLEMNYSLFYSRFALKDEKLCMLFDSAREVASPNKLYYGLKELATKADKQDDLLVSDFATLKAVDDLHVEIFSDSEKEIKYKYFSFWIESTLKKVEELNQDSFSGGIAYLFLTLIYKIDYLITPEGKLLNEIERINSIYWLNKEEKTSVERNQLLKDAFKKLLGWEKSEVLKYFYRAKATFSVNVPKAQSEIADIIKSSLENMLWYKDNKYPEIANAVMEYGISYCQYTYSLPKPSTDLFNLFMHINYASFFKELGFTEGYYNEGTFKMFDIQKKIDKIISGAQEKYPQLQFNTDQLNFTSLVDFNQSFLKQMELLHFESKA